MYLSIPSLTITPGKPSANCFCKGESPPLGHKENAKRRLLGQKPTPGEIIFKYPAKNNKTWIRQKLWNANMFEAFKSPKLLGGWLLWIFKISQIILHSSINQQKKFMASKYQNTTLINNNCYKNSNQLYLWFSRLAIDKNTPGNSLKTDRMWTINLAMQDNQHLQKWLLGDLKILSKWPKTVYVIKDTVDIHCFCRNWYETAQELLLFKLPPVSLKQIEKLLHFSFRIIENFSNSKPRTPGWESWAKIRPPPQQWERANPRGSPEGGWSGLELTDT